jgi:putative spermidine/putrescine transport system substrate-binding protein
VQFLANSIPPQLLKQFQAKVSDQLPLAFAPVEQLSELYSRLQQWHDGDTEQAGQARRAISLPFIPNRPARIPDLVTLGDYWLTPAIRQQLIQPLDLDTLSGWNDIPNDWKALVRRDRQGFLVEDGPVWAAPYRWGHLVIAYRIDEFKHLGWAPTDWGDLWRDDLQSMISLPDSPRTVIGIALKYLEQSFNTANVESIEELEDALIALQQRVKVYSSDAYLQPLILGDTWLAVGWSTDVLPVIRRNPRLAAVVPASGTLLTADLWVQPATSAENTLRSPSEATESASQATSSSLIAQWIDFCWQPAVATELSLLSSAASPIFADGELSNRPTALRDRPLLIPDVEQLQASEFLLPLDDDALTQYGQLWTKIRQMS